MQDIEFLVDIRYADILKNSITDINTKKLFPHTY